MSQEKERKTRRVQLALRPSFYRRIENYCTAFGTRVTDVFEAAVAKYIDSHCDKDAKHGEAKNVQG